MPLSLTVDARNLYLYFHGWLFLARFYLLHVLPSFSLFFCVLFWQFFGRNLSALEALRHWDTEILGKCGDADKEKTDATGEKSDGETGLSGSRNSTESAVPQPKPKSHPRLQHHQQHHPQKPHHSLFCFSRDTAFFSMQNSQNSWGIRMKSTFFSAGMPPKRNWERVPQKGESFSRSALLPKKKMKAPRKRNWKTLQIVGKNI